MSHLENPLEANDSDSVAFFDLLLTLPPLGRLSILSFSTYKQHCVHRLSLHVGESRLPNMGYYIPNLAKTPPIWWIVLRVL